MTKAFIDAVKANNLEAVQEFLKDPEFDVNFMIDAPLSVDRKVAALHIASLNGYTKIITELLAHPKIDPNILTQFNRSALHAAASTGQVEACGLLLGKVKTCTKDKTKKLAYTIAKQKATDPSLTTEKSNFMNIMQILGLPTFIAACHLGELDIVKKLVEDNIDINGIYWNRTGLLGAIWHRKKEVFDYLLSLDSIDVNKEIFDKNTTLHLIGKPKNFPIPQSEVDYEWDSPIVYMVKKLIEKGAQTNTRNDDGLTPLYMAVNFNSLVTVKALVENGADLDLRYSTPDSDVNVDIFQAAEAKKQIYQYLKETKLSDSSDYFIVSKKKLNSILFKTNYLKEEFDNLSILNKELVV